MSGKSRRWKGCRPNGPASAFIRVPAFHYSPTRRSNEMRTAERKLRSGKYIAKWAHCKGITERRGPRIAPQLPKVIESTGCAAPTAAIKAWSSETNFQNNWEKMCPQADFDADKVLNTSPQQATIRQNKI
eukprot:scaffold15199_cov170-Amphora_coffeaeformis.AAC.1